MAGVELLAGTRQEGESPKAVIACNDFLRIGSGRTMRKLLEQYEKSRKNAPPTRSWNTIKKWAVNYGWQERAAIYDALVEQRKNERRDRIMNSGLAQAHNRVVSLKKLARFLLDQVYEEDAEGNHPRVWLRDVKQIGTGDAAERVDIEHFNAALIRELRGVLDDLAKEVGERRSHTDGTNINVDATQLTDEQLLRIAKGEDVAFVLATPGIGGAGTSAA